MALKLGEKIKQFLGLAAPTILKATGGPLGAIAGTFVQKALGVTDDDAAVAALQSNPEALVQLKQAEMAFKQHIADAGITEEQLDAQDRESARDLAVKTSLWPQVSLSVLFVGGYFIILVLFFSQELRIPMNEAFMVMLGVLTAGVPQILNFWLGSSHGSLSKDATIAKIAQSP